MTVHDSPTRTGKTVHANGIDIHYVEQGEGTPLVLLHGGSISTNPVWDALPVSYGPHMATMVEGGYRVVAADRRGSGLTVHPADGGTISFATIVDDVVGLMDALDLDRPVVWGFSEGGLVALLVAITHPDRVRAAISHAGHDYLNPNGHSVAMMRTFFGGSPEATEPNPDAAVAFAEAVGFSAFIELLKADLDGAHGEGTWRRHISDAWFRASRSPGYTFADLATIEAPTLITVGDRDMFCSVEEGLEAYRALRLGEYAVLPGEDHSVSALGVAVTLDFLSRHAG